MNIIAHRGFRTTFIKENTMEAFENAIKNGFNGIEMDVRNTKDKVLVLCHDPFINRVSNGIGLLRNYIYKDLLKYNFGSDTNPSKITLLKQAMKLKCLKIIELKENIDCNKIIKYIDENTYFISFNSNMIYNYKKKYPELKFGVLNYVLNSNDNYNLDVICILEAIMTKNLERYFTRRNIKIFIYGIGKKIKYVTNNNNVYYIVDYLPRE